MLKRPLLIEVDKAQAEWIIVAYLANDPAMLHIIEQGLDAHAKTGSLISGVSLDIVSEERKALGHITDPSLILKAREEKFPNLEGTGFIPRNMTIRQMGKKSNHALNYDMTYRRFSLENETPERDSKRIVEAYHSIYPNIRHTFHANVRRDLERNRTLTNCFGRKRRFLGQWSNDLFKAGYDHIPQSTVADLINRAYCLIYEKETPYHTFLPVTQVHDSILLESYYSSTEELWEGLQRINGYMSPTLTYNNHDFVIATDAQGGYSWGEANMADLSLTNYDTFSAQLEELEAAA